MVISILAENIDWYSLKSFSKLHKNQTHLFFFNVKDEYYRIKEIYDEFLSYDEIKKSNKYSKEDDKRRYIVGKYLTRKILSSFLEVEPTLISFSETENKKPKFENLEFNISHSGNSLVIAISNHEVGVDIEEIKADFDYKQIMHEIFSNEEILLIEKDKNHSLIIFYTLWCRKEALLKATGEGLANNLSEIDVLKNEIKRFDFDYNLFSFNIGSDYALSLALKGTSKIQFWKFSANEAMFFLNKHGNIDFHIVE